jgi:molecular chaperone DnaK (HSP70)
MTGSPVKTVLEKAELSSDDVDDVLLVGGLTRIPAIQKQLEEFVGVEPTMTIDPDKIVAQGAAVYAQREIESGYCCPICGKEYDALLKLNEHYDDRHSDVDEDEYECSHCDESFESEDERQRHQATAHAGDSAEGEGGITDPGSGITDIISHSLGTKLEDGSMAVLVEQGTNTEDAKATDLFTTTEDDQTVIPVGVYQGESDVAEENEKIGEVRLTDIPPRPAGDPRIEITFDYDQDGILHAEAVDQDSGDEVNGEIEM